MKNTMTKALALLLVAVMMFSLAGCGGDSEGSSTGTPAQTSAGTSDSPADTGGDAGETADQPAPAGEQVFRVNIDQEPTILDPFQFRDDKATPIVYALHEPLIRMSGENGMDWEPGLATDFTASDDATEYTINLREDAKWSDGTPITAEDVVYSFQRAVDPANAFEKAFDYYLIKNGEAIVSGEAEVSELGVEAVDEHTVKFTMERPVDYFVDYLKTPGYAPIQKAAGEANKELYGTDPDKMVFSGPFMLTSWEHDASMVLEKNPEYWDAANVKLDKIEVSLVLDSNTIVGMYQAGELDFVELNNDVFDQYSGEEGYDSIIETRSSFIEFNPGVDYLNNAKIREALSIAFDRTAYATSVLRQPEIAAYGLVPYGMRGLDGGDFREQQGDLAKDMANDPDAKERANKLLEEGLAEMGKTKADMEGFIEVLCIDSPSAKTQAQAIQAMWKDNLELNLTVTPMQVKMLLPMLMDGTFHCVVGGGRTAQTPDAAYMIDFVYDENKWDDETFRGMIEDSREKTGDERVQILMDAEKYLMDYYVYIPQVYATRYFILGTNVDGFLQYPYGLKYDFKYTSITE